MENQFVVKGVFLDTPMPDAIRVRDGYVHVVNGKFAEFSETMQDEWKDLKLDDYSGKMILPGFSDLHLHAPQYSYAGYAMDVQLLEWLEKYTYPEEAKYADMEYAKEGYKYFVKDLKDGMTTRSCIFATIHTDATVELMKQLEDSGQVSFVGKLNMNRNSPDDYCEESTQHGMNETARWLDACEKLQFQNNKPIITPRFTPSVTDDYMQELGSLAKERNLPMQSHLSENPDEVVWVSQLCPDTAFYGETYARFGLFGKECPTVMAHCIHSGAEELQLMKDNGVFIAHCPTSNVNIVSGIAPAAYYLRNGFHVGLGSDVAGGHTLNMFEVMRTAIGCSKLRYFYVDKTQKPLSLPEVLYMATVGGGEFFGKVGLFEAEYEFDAVVVDDSSLWSAREATIQERLERYTYRGSGIAYAKYVCGRKIK